MMKSIRSFVQKSSCFPGNYFVLRGNSCQCKMDSAKSAEQHVNEQDGLGCAKWARQNGHLQSAVIKDYPGNCGLAARAEKERCPMANCAPRKMERSRES
jgi:hypothetical protein